MDAKPNHPPKAKSDAIRELLQRNRRLAQHIWGKLPFRVLLSLEQLGRNYQFSITCGDLFFLDGTWYVTHVALIRLARRLRCAGIHVHALSQFCEVRSSQWAFRATVYTNNICKGFVGYGDANPSNVSPAVRGAEMRIAETRAVNRALRKAYGIGICSVEELGVKAEAARRSAEPKKKAQRVNGNHDAPKLRDRLFQLIRQHQLDPNLVKGFALDFCRTNNLREASREQIESFITQLAERAEKDRDALLCQLNSYLPVKEGAA
jgi:hypothetical protein